MTATTELGQFAQDLARIDRMVRIIDTVGLRYRLGHNERDQIAFADQPTTMVWLRYEYDAITEELTRRTGG